MLIHPNMKDDDGKPLCMVWNQIIRMYQFSIGLRRVRAWYRSLKFEVVYPSALAGMRVWVNRGVLNANLLARLKVAREKKLPHAKGTEALDWYLRTLLRILVPMRGGGPGYADPEDKRIKDMEAALKELEDWRRSFGEGKEGQQARAAGCIPDQLFADLQQMVYGFTAALGLLRAEFGNGMEPVSPTVFSQDRTEGLFGQIRFFVGGGTVDAAQFLDALYALEVMRYGPSARRVMSRSAAKRTNVGREDVEAQLSEDEWSEVGEDDLNIDPQEDVSAPTASAPAAVLVAAVGSCTDDEDCSSDLSDADPFHADNDDDVYGSESDPDASDAAPAAELEEPH